MLGAKHDYELLIQEQHLDTFGHVNNAAYLQILEQARWDLITHNGYGLQQVHERRRGPTIVEIQMRFLRELKNRQKVTVRSWVESYTGKVGKFAQQIWDATGTLCCDTLFTMGLFDLDARKLIAPTPEWIEALGLTSSDFTKNT